VHYNLSVVLFIVLSIFYEIAVPVFWYFFFLLSKCVFCHCMFAMLKLSFCLSWLHFVICRWFCSLLSLQPSHHHPAWMLGAHHALPLCLRNTEESLMPFIFIKDGQVVTLTIDLQFSTLYRMLSTTQPSEPSHHYPFWKKHVTTFLFLCFRHWCH
jgi:hypothetical protein